MKSLILSVAALNQTPIDWANNVNNIKKAINKAVENQADLLVLPELCLTGYGCEDLFLSEWIYTKSIHFLGELLQYNKNITYTVGLPIKYQGKRYNACCVIQNNKIISIVPKQFLANDGVHYEARWFEPWEKNKIEEIDILGTKVPIGDLPFLCKEILIGIEICEDAWRGTQRPGINLKNKGAQIIINPSASPFAFGKTYKREKEVVLDACKNLDVIYAYANLVGNESGRIIFDGDLMVATPSQGIVLKNKRFQFKEVQVLSTQIDVEEKIAHPITLFDDYNCKEKELVGALTLGLYDYLRKSQAKGFVLSLSGGADSSLCAVMIAEMIKKGIKELGLMDFLKKINIKDQEIKSEKELMEQILSCAYQWSSNSSKETFTSAKALAQEIGAKFYSWRIDDEVKSYTQKIESCIGRQLNWDTDDIALQNIQARSRSPIIWMLANIQKALLITTSNRSEGDVGYATMDGDTSGSLAPIAGLDKAFIREWLKWAEKNLGYQSLKHVNELQPTAELRPAEKTQTDEDDLMPYTILLEIEKLAILERKSPLRVYELLKNKNICCNDMQLKNYIKKFYRLWSLNQWKRERLAPSFLLDEFNVDPKTWCRFPILSGGFNEELKELFKNEETYS